MNIIEALEQNDLGFQVRRPKISDQYSFILFNAHMGLYLQIENDCYRLDHEDLKAGDWEAREPEISLSKSQIQNAFDRINLKVEGDLRRALLRELGFK